VATGEIILADTIYVPGCPYSLISQSKAIVAGYYISIMTNEVMNPQGDLAFRLAPLPGGLLVVEGVVVAQETHNTLVAGVDELKDKRKIAAEQRAARQQRGRLTPTVARVVKPTAATRAVPRVEMSTALVPCDARTPLTSGTLETSGPEPLRTATGLADGVTGAHAHRGGLPVRQYDDIDEDSWGRRVGHSGQRQRWHRGLGREGRQPAGDTVGDWCCTPCWAWRRGHRFGRH
jgi:hypothetical protein